MITKFLDPKNDIAFKRIFGSEKNKDILIHFLNDMLIFREKKPITEVTFLKTIQDPEIASKKTSIVDILCKDDVGNTYVVEMQASGAKGFEKRAQYYASKAYIAQMNKGDKKYYNLKEVIFLAIADFTMFPKKKGYKSDHVILDKDTHENDLKDFSFTFLELEKFTKGKDELHSMVEKWTYYFKHAEDTSEEDLHKIFENDWVIQRAYEELNRFNWNEEELMAYEDEIKRAMDNQAVLEEKLDQAEAKGIAKGIAKGKAEGEQLGLAKGKAEVALNLLKLGIDPKSVSAATGIAVADLPNPKL